MSVCVLYILMGGGVFLTPDCAPVDGVAYPDKIVYAQSLPRVYSYVPFYMPARAPRIVYRDWRPLPYSYRNRYPYQKPSRVQRRNITIHRHYHGAQKANAHVKKAKIRIKNSKKKKHFKKKK